MKSRKNLELARRLTLRRGVPKAPSAKEVPTEVRSNSFVAIDEPPGMDTSYAIGNVVVEWTYRVPPEEFRAFTAFLADNEAMIVASCGKLMQGVHYRGTFLVTDLGRFEFRTYWAYDTSATEKQWDRALGNANSNFAQAVAQLRSYWLKDPNASHRHMILASLLSDKTMGAFFKFTVSTAEGLSGGGTRAAARKKGGKK